MYQTRLRVNAYRVSLTTKKNNPNTQNSNNEFQGFLI